MISIKASLLLLALLTQVATGQDLPTSFEHAAQQTNIKIYTNSIGIKFIDIPAGTFTMGGPEPYNDLLETSYPRHEVVISKSFLLSQYEITRGQFKQFIADTKYQTRPEQDGLGRTFNSDKQWGAHKGYTWKNTGFSQTDNHPVVIVAYPDAIAFCEWISKKEGKHYRLPTEAEWEYAARAGSTSSHFNNIDLNQPNLYANYGDKQYETYYGKGLIRRLTGKDSPLLQLDDGYAQTAPVGSYRPNPWGLYDMVGNVAEWCMDYKAPYSDEKVIDPIASEGYILRCVRGSTFATESTLTLLSVDSRGSISDFKGSATVGFRIVLEQSNNSKN